MFAPGAGDAPSLQLIGLVVNGGRFQFGVTGHRPGVVLAGVTDLGDAAVPEAGDDGRAGGYALPMRDRHQTALRMRSEGATFQMIGDALGVSPSRANVIYQRAVVVRLERETGLRMRSIRIVRGSARIPTEWATMLADDREKAFLALLQEVNCDRRHAEEIIAWLDAGHHELPAIVKPPPWSNFAS